jgi:hypothetical protein
MDFTQNEADAINAVLNERGVPAARPVCGQANVALMGRYVYLIMTNDPRQAQVEGGKGTPCACLVCPNCGNVQYHSLQQLGLT